MNKVTLWIALVIGCLIKQEDVTMLEFSGSQTRQGFDRKKYQQSYDRIFGKGENCPYYKETPFVITVENGTPVQTVKIAFKDKLTIPANYDDSFNTFRALLNSKKYKSFLGKFTVEKECSNYGKASVFLVTCEDGRVYGGDFIGLIDAIEADYCQKVPRLERFIQEQQS